MAIDTISCADFFKVELLNHIGSSIQKGGYIHMRIHKRVVGEEIDGCMYLNILVVNS